MLEVNIIKKARSVKEASGILYNCTTGKKNALLKAINDRLRSETSAILKANRKDLMNAAQNGLQKILLDRLTLNELRIKQMIAGVKDVVKLPDPVGKVIEKIKRPNGLLIEKMRVPWVLWVLFMKRGRM